MRHRWRHGLGLSTLLVPLCLFAGRALGADTATTSNIPDAVTRTSGLRVMAMPRAAVTYAANCQCCHGNAGVAVAEFPALAGRIGYFVRSEAGRRYLLEVPNVALNQSSDADIAEMMNWILVAFSRDELPHDFKPYSADEVAAARTSRIDTAVRRRQVVDELAALKLVASVDVLTASPGSTY
jgi:mono/diheme cytochrome c family protein